MDLGLKGKVAIVGGASKGLGKAVALGLAEEGARVVIAARNVPALESARDELEKKTGAEVLALAADLSKPDDIDRLVRSALARFGGVDVLIANAGGPKAGRFKDLAPADYQAGIELSLLGTIHLCRAVVPSMRERGGGRIINIASTSVKEPIDGLMLSNLARAGLVGFAKTLSFELARDNILVNTLCPGVIYSDRVLEMSAIKAKEQGITVEEHLRNKAQRDIPMGRIGEAREFADVAVFLASGRASYVTGTVIQVDGGMVKSLF
jgi:3-oxoacyl-[acyl-carrier protein] reductase